MSRTEYECRGRVGLIVPPANTTLEPELAAMMPPGVSLHSTRLPGRVSNDTSIGLRDRLVEYNRALALTADSFGGATLSALCFGVTGSCYLVGPEGEKKLFADLRTGGTQKVITAASAIRRLLEAVGGRRIGLVTPYPSWLVEFCVRYWQACGYEVAAVARLPDVVSIYAIETQDVVAAAREATSGADVVVLSGTGVPTLPAIEILTKSLPVPVVSSNLGLGWWIFETLGIADPDETPSLALRSIYPWLSVGAPARKSAVER